MSRKLLIRPPSLMLGSTSFVSIPMKSIFIPSISIMRKGSKRLASLLLILKLEQMMGKLAHFSMNIR